MGHIVQALQPLDAPQLACIEVAGLQPHVVCASQEQQLAQRVEGSSAASGERGVHVPGTA